MKHEYVITKEASNEQVINLYKELADECQLADQEFQERPSRLSGAYYQGLADAMELVKKHLGVKLEVKEGPVEINPGDPKRLF